MASSPDPNGVLGQIFDILTTGSPLKTKPTREAIKAIGGFLTTVPEPISIGFGSSLLGLAHIFELREKARRKNK